MKGFRFLASAAIIASAAFSTSAFAQATAPVGAPAFRVPLKDGTNDPGVPAVWTWKEVVSACSTTCGTGTRTTTYECQNVADYDFSSGGYGVAEPAASCTAGIGAAPATTSASCTNYSACSYDWVVPAVQKTATPPGRVGCGEVRSKFEPYCRRSDNTVLGTSDHTFCQNDRPDYDPVAAGQPDALGYDRTAVDTSACTTTDHQWVSGAWGPWTNGCSTTATHTRSITCQRKFDSATVADASCDAASKPAASETQPVYSSCSYTWTESAWSAYSSTCSANATRTKSVTCTRSNGDTVADSNCTTTKPASSETSAQYSGCSYAAANWGNDTYSSTCSATATRTQTAQCQRSSGDIVADSECTSRSIALTKTDVVANYSTCSFDWAYGAWSASSSNCSASATQTRTVTCRRSDGTTAADTSCNAATKQAASQVVPTYSGCSYVAGGTTTYGAWASSCAASTTRNAHKQCVRSDSTIVADSECTSRSVSLDSTDTGSNYSGCSYDWSYGAWSASSSNCSATATQSRSVTCLRSDGAPSADASCNAGTRQPASQVVPTYSGCGYDAGGTTSYGAWAAGCSASTTRNAHKQCVRSDNTIVPDSDCTSRGVSLDSTDTGSNYAGCTYDWTYGAWSASSSTCSASATQTRTVQCRRADGTIVADASCNAATRQGASQQVADYSGCGYSAVNWGSGTWNSTCSASATLTETAQCQRADGSIVASSECTNRGIPLTRTSTTANYSGCGYSWQTSGWSGYSSTCSASAAQTRAVWCQRADGTTVADASCSSAGSRPADTQYSAQYSGCSYSAVNWSSPSYSSTCSSNATITQTGTCRRSDGADVAASECTSRGVSLTQTSTGSNYSGCTYAASYGGWSACSGSSQTRTVTCTRADGAQVDASYCGTTNTQSQACSSGVAAIGFYFGAITGQSNWNWYQLEGPSRSLSGANQQPYYACPSLGYTIRIYDDFLPPNDASVRGQIVQNTCYEYSDARGTPYDFDGAGQERTVVYRKP